eukprot:TRINITY_DN49796_c0_g1_i1.p1 TRINITY_DN49796_c0_g1~~TRINITY_DN49796_c0_g1_i1.p1  ORF type:complete len:345 (-),score=72.75 TRINITY_DN49796_c0_g1_i1:459-1493(-)
MMKRGRQQSQCNGSSSLVLGILIGAAAGSAGGYFLLLARQPPVQAAAATTVACAKEQAAVAVTPEILPPPDELSCHFAGALLWFTCEKVASYLKLESLNRRKPVWQSFVKVDAVPGRNRAVDVGANIGQETLWLAEAGFQVDSFEPSPNFRKRVNDGLAKLGQAAVDRVSMHPVAIAEIEGNATFYEAGERSTFGENMGTGVSYPVDIRRLDKMGLKWPEVLFLKIDTQGFDAHVLKGLGVHLREERIPYIYMEFDPRAMEARGKSFDIEPLVMFRDAGYVILDEKHMLDAPTSVRRGLDRYPHKIDHWTNIFAIHRAEAQELLTRQATRAGHPLRETPYAAAT